MSQHVVFNSILMAMAIAGDDCERQLARQWYRGSRADFQLRRGIGPQWSRWWTHRIGIRRLESRSYEYEAFFLSFSNSTIYWLIRRLINSFWFSLIRLGAVWQLGLIWVSSGCSTTFLSNRKEVVNADTAVASTDLSLSQSKRWVSVQRRLYSNSILLSLNDDFIDDWWDDYRWLHASEWSRVAVAVKMPNCRFNRAKYQWNRNWFGKERRAPLTARARSTSSTNIAYIFYFSMRLQVKSWIGFFVLFLSQNGGHRNTLSVRAVVIRSPQVPDLNKGDVMVCLKAESTIQPPSTSDAINIDGYTQPPSASATVEYVMGFANSQQCPTNQTRFKLLLKAQAGDWVMERRNQGQAGGGDENLKLPVYYTQCQAEKMTGNWAKGQTPQTDSCYRTAVDFTTLSNYQVRIN